MFSTPSEHNEHIFKTNLGAEKFDAIVTRSCRAPFSIAVVAEDPTLIPPIRLVSVSFASLEDRDRVRIAMRFVEKELVTAERARAHTHIKQPRLVGA